MHRMSTTTRAKWPWPSKPYTERPPITSLHAPRLEGISFSWAALCIPVSLAMDYDTFLWRAEYVVIHFVRAFEETGLLPRTRNVTDARRNNSTVISARNIATTRNCF